MMLLIRMSMISILKAIRIHHGLGFLWNLTSVSGFMVLLFPTACTHLKEIKQPNLFLKQIFTCRPQHYYACPLCYLKQTYTLHTLQQSTTDWRNFHLWMCVHTVVQRAALYEGTRLVCCLWVSLCLPLSVIESRVALRWQLAGLILTHEGRSPAPGVTQTCQAWRRCIQPGRLVSLVPCHSGP